MCAPLPGILQARQNLREHSWAIDRKNPLFENLGVNAIELMPIFEFDECENKNINPKDRKRGLRTLGILDHQFLHSDEPLYLFYRMDSGNGRIPHPCERDA